MSWIVANWKLAVAGLVIAIRFASGWHLHSISDKAEQAKDLTDEIARHQLDQQTANDRSADLEHQLAASRVITYSINQKKEQTLAHTSPTVNCVLPPERLHIITSAIAGSGTR